MIQLIFFAVLNELELEKNPQTMDMVEMAVHQVVCQKSDFHEKSNIQNSKKQDPSTNIYTSQRATNSATLTTKSLLIYFCVCFSVDSHFNP
jgi:hypothetical protein